MKLPGPGPCSSPERSHDGPVGAGLVNQEIACLRRAHVFADPGVGQAALASIPESRSLPRKAVLFGSFNLVGCENPPGLADALSPMENENAEA